MPSIDIIEENDDFLIINKPADLSFHSDSGEAGIFALVEEQLKRNLWPVHRLDKITSGLLIVAKNKISAVRFGELFEQRNLLKIYIAISDKKPNKKQGKIIGDMQKSRGGSWKLSKTRLNPAITQFESQSLLPGKRLFWVKPKTGKTHQIRAALKSLGSPILGDSRYAGSAADRGYLHAYKISFPWNNEILSFSCLPTQGELFLSSEFAQAIAFFEN